jgi:hypothetical protein
MGKKLPTLDISGKVIIVPAGVTSVRSGQFSFATPETVEFEPGSMMKKLALQAFRDCPRLKSFCIPRTVEILGEGWPWHFGEPFAMQSITFEPDSQLRIIHNYTFCDFPAVKSIIIPASVVTMTGLAFHESGIQTIAIAKGNAKFRNSGKFVVNAKGDCLVRYSSADPEVFIGDDIRKLDQGCFSSCQWVMAIEFSARSRIRQIPQEAFELCNGLVSLCLPASVETLGRLAFARCGHLCTITFAPGSQLKEIGPHAFSKCYELQSIAVPPFVSTLDEGCFERCFSLTNVVFAANSVLSTIGDRAFSGCFSLASLCLPASLTRIAEKSFLDCDLLTMVGFEAPSRIRELLDLPPHAGPIDVPDSVEELVLSGDSDGRSGWHLIFGLESRLCRVQIMAHCFLSSKSGETTLWGSARIERAEWSKDPEHPKRSYCEAHGGTLKRELIPKGFLKFATHTVKQMRARAEFQGAQQQVVTVESDDEDLGRRFW